MNTPYPRLLNIKPTVSALAERYELNELFFADDFTPTEKDVEDSINLLFYQQSVAVYTLETNTCEWNVATGYKFVKSILMFFNNTVTYPEGGFLEDFQGKTFSTLKSSYQRRIMRSEVPICLCCTMKGAEQVYEAIINSASLISQP